MVSHLQRLLYPESYHRIRRWQTLVAFQPKTYPTFLLRHGQSWITPETLRLQFLGAVVKLGGISGCKPEKGDISNLGTAGGSTSVLECPINTTIGPLIVISYLIAAPIKTLSWVSFSRFAAGKVVTLQGFLNKSSCLIKPSNKYWKAPDSFSDCVSQYRSVATCTHGTHVRTWKSCAQKRYKMNK